MYTAQQSGHFGKNAINTLVKADGIARAVFLIFSMGWVGFFIVVFWL
jgi:hypothetical protein